MFGVFFFFSFFLIFFSPSSGIYETVLQMLTNLTNFVLNHECILIHYSNCCSNEYFCIPSNMLKEGFLLPFFEKKKPSAISLYSLIKIQLITNTIKPFYHSLQKRADGSKVVSQRSNRE